MSSDSSIRPISSSGVRYDPLPLETDLTDHHYSSQDFSEPMSPRAEPASLPLTEPPPGAAVPRFLGRVTDNDMRQSFASSHTPSGASAYSSVYALNPQHYDSGRSTPQLGGYRDDPQANFMDMSPSLTLKGGELEAPSNYLSGKRAAYAAPQRRSRRKLLIFGGLAVLFVIIVAVVVAIYFTVIKPNNDSDSQTLAGGSSAAPTATTGAAGATSSGTATLVAVTGGDGSTITMDDGTTFTYQNSFGGSWYFDENDPFNNGARAQSWTPALNETFNYGVDIIRGVNLGGWLVTEPFIAPSLFEKYLNQSINVVDEWTLSEAMSADPNGGLGQLEDHYKTFITEQDFAEIAGAGLNFVRIPLPYWAIETWDGEPFLAQTSWTYFLKAIQWARKYGLRINLDFHALPGSQNGWNHSGKLGSFNVLNGPMGYANAERSLSYIRILAEFISQPQYSDVVPMLGVTNEPQGVQVGQVALSAYYLQAYNNVRLASGIGENNGPMISYHDGFLGLPNWAGFLPGADRISLDLHPYICFGAQSSSPLSSFVNVPCTTWGAEFNTSMAAFGLTVAGEFSNAVNDCGLWVNGVNEGTRYEGTFPGYTVATGSCDTFVDWQSWDDATKQDYMQFALHSMDSLQNWFFWTWKIGNSSTSGLVESPQWSYQLGLQQGWMPTDPRQSIGQCGFSNVWEGPLEPNQTGGSGAGQIPASVSATLVWPPATISNAGAVTLLPSYTPTASLVTLAVPTFTALSGTSTASAGSGWQNTADTAGIMTDIAGCSYLDPWIGPTAPPSPLCTAAAKREAAPEPVITAVAL